MKVALYARVSTIDKEQNPEVQLQQLRSYCERMEWSIYKEFVDHASGADLLHRTEWTQLMKEAATRRFDIVLVWKLDRAFRSSIHAHNTVQLWQSQGINFCSYSEPAMNTNTPNGMFLFSIMAAYAEMERAMIKERVTAGMTYAKEHGTKSGNAIGRPRIPFGFEKVCKALQSSGNSYSEAARILSSEGERVTPGFVFNRVKREADTRGISQPELLQVILRQNVEQEEDKLKTYRISLRATNQYPGDDIEARSPEEACQAAGWNIDDCWVRVKTERVKNNQTESGYSGGGWANVTPSQTPVKKVGAK